MFTAWLTKSQDATRGILSKLRLIAVRQRINRSTSTMPSPNKVPWNRIRNNYEGCQDTHKRTVRNNLVVAQLLGEWSLDDNSCVEWENIEFSSCFSLLQVVQPIPGWVMGGDWTLTWGVPKSKSHEVIVTNSFMYAYTTRSNSTISYNFLEVLAHSTINYY